MNINTDMLVFIIIFIIATVIMIKTIGYGIFEIKEKNKFGGSLVVFISVISYLLFIIMMYLE